ncbi:MAG: cell division topological specificity factor MinE [Phormidesmis sp.]
MPIPIISDLIERLFGPAEDPHSRDDVKRRLQIVLAHDRLALDPQTLEMMRQEIIAVVSRYVEVDFESLEFSLATNERVTALTANLPIRRIRPLGRGADQPIKPDDEVERIELASPAEAVALDAKETEAALKKFESDNSDAHPHLDIDRTGLDVASLDEDDGAEAAELSVIEEVESSSEALDSTHDSEAIELPESPMTDVTLRGTKGLDKADQTSA